MIDYKYDGFVLLEINGKYFVPRFTRDETESIPFHHYKRHWTAHCILLSRAGQNPFDLKRLL